MLIHDTIFAQLMYQLPLYQLLLCKQQLHFLSRSSKVQLLQFCNCKLSSVSDIIMIILNSYYQNVGSVQSSSQAATSNMVAYHVWIFCHQVWYHTWWSNGKALAWCVGGCGFNSRLDHTKTSKMVLGASFLKGFSIKKVRPRKCGQHGSLLKSAWIYLMVIKAWKSPWIS